MKQKCLFIDRDGTINKFNRGYNYKIEHIQLIPGVDKLIAEFCKRGYKIVVITNQGGIACGIYTEEDVYAVNAHIASLLAPSGGRIDKVYFCPHHVQGIIEGLNVECSCRKPGNLLLEQAIADFNADVSKSLFLGDNFTDMQCAQKSKVAFYPFSFKRVITTSQGFRTEIKEYSEELIQSILSFAESL